MLTTSGKEKILKKYKATLNFKDRTEHNVPKKAFSSVQVDLYDIFFDCKKEKIKEFYH